MVIERHSGDSAFLGARIKLARARALIGDVERELEEFTQSYATRIQTRFPGGKLASLTVQTTPGPHAAGVIAADTIHNLRTALDLMASELVRRSGFEGASALFPFAQSAEALDSQIKQKHFDHAGSSAVALLKSLRPYTGGNADLRGLHDLDIQDKHVALTPTALSFSSSFSHVAEEPGAQTPDERNPIELRFRYPKGAVFAGQDIVPTLERLRVMVAGIVDAFDDLLAGRAPSQSDFRISP